MLASRLDAPERGRDVATEMRQAIDDVRRATHAALSAGARRPRVFVAEWIDPPSHPTTWDAVSASDPELLVIAACGFDAEEAARRSADLDLDRIAPNARVVVVDGDSYYSRPGPRLADVVRQLGLLIHPGAVEDPGLPLIELPLSRAMSGGLLRVGTTASRSADQAATTLRELPRTTG